MQSCGPASSSNATGPAPHQTAGNQSRIANKTRWAGQLVLPHKPTGLTLTAQQKLKAHAVAVNLRQCNHQLPAATQARQFYGT